MCLVYSVAKRGIDEDEGRRPVTFRYRPLPDLGGEAGGEFSDVQALARLKSTVLIDNEKRAS